MTGRLAFALGLAALLSARQFAVWSSPSQRFFYHWTRGDAVAFVASMVLIAAVIAALEWTIRRFASPRAHRTAALLAVSTGYAALAGLGLHPRPIVPLTTGFLLALPVAIVLRSDRIRGRLLLAALGAALLLLAWVIWPRAIGVVWALRRPLPGLFTPLAWSALVAAAWHISHDKHRLLVPGMRLALTLAVPLGPLLAFQALWWTPWGPDTTIAPTPGEGGTGAPVVVIVFDEWAREYALAPDGSVIAELPGIAAVSAASVTFSEASSPGTSTLAAMPRLLAQADGELRVAAGGADWVGREGGTPLPFDRAPTIISQARSAGYQVDLVGYYLPYTRLLAGTLRSGYAPPSVPRPATAFGAVLATLRRTVYFWPLPGARQAFRQVGWWGRPVFDHAWYRLQNELADSAIAAIERVGPGELLLIHLPTPHPPLVRAEGGGRADAPPGADPDALIGSYVEQVRYTDAILARLWAGLGRSGARDSALIIVTSDHGWRTGPSAPAMGPEHYLEVPLWVTWPGAPAGTRSGQGICTARLGSLFALAFSGGAALRRGAPAALASATGMTGCHAEHPPSIIVDWF